MVAEIIFNGIFIGVFMSLIDRALTHFKEVPK